VSGKKDMTGWPSSAEWSNRDCYAAEETGRGDPVALLERRNRVDRVGYILSTKPREV
jgi:hypothetical protein